SDGELKIIGTDLKLKPQQIVEAKFMILLPKDSITKMNTPVEIGVYDGDKQIKKIKTSFLGPVEKN
ncbi:MAG: FixG Ig-like domain-containing protein, partial [Ignavibacterium sp.]